MNESYAEAGVRRKQTMKHHLIRASLITLVAFIFLFGTPLLGLFAMPVASIGIIACIFLFPRLNVEYEYIFCDGQLDFDKIMGGAKRKTVLRVDFEKVEIVAPVNSHSLDSYNNNPQIKVKDFTSMQPNKKVYALILREEGITKILFEPNEKMIECIKQKTPRKISEY